MPGPVGVQVFGAYAIRPGVFSSIDASAMVPNRPGPGGTVGFVGMADGGVPGVVYNFRRYSDALAVIRGGPALAFLARLFAPSPNPDVTPGASLVRFTRIGAPTRSTLTAAGLLFTTRDYGRHTQGVSLTIVQNAGAAAVAASGLLTSDAGIPSDGDTVTLDAKTYTFKTALTPTEGQVLIGASAATALANLKSAINHTGVPGTDYSAVAAHPTVTAGVLTATTLAVAAITTGTAGNSIVSAKVAVRLSWGAANLSGGAAAVPTTYTNTIRKRLDGYVRSYISGLGLSVTCSAAVLPKVVFDHAGRQVKQYENGVIVATLDYGSGDSVTLSTVAAFLTARAGWTAVVKGDPSMPVRFMDNPVLGSAPVITVSPVTLPASQGSLIWQLSNLDAQVTADVVSIGTYTDLAAVAETYFAGGTGTANDAFSSNDWAAGLALLENQDVHLLFMATADPTARNLGYLHVLNMRQVLRKRWRIFFTGGAASESAAAANAVAPTLDGPVVYCQNGSYYPNPVSGVAENLGGLGTAAQVCGMAAGSYAKVPLTNKSIVASALEVPSPLDGDIDSMLTAGVTTIAPDPVTGQPVIVQAITTYQGGANSAYRTLQGLRIQDELSRMVQRVLSNYVGAPLDDQTGELIKNDMGIALDGVISSAQNPAGYLTRGVTNGQETSAWEGLEVEGDGINLWDVRVTVHPVGETDYIRVAIKLTPVHISL